MAAPSDSLQRHLARCEAALEARRFAAAESEARAALTQVPGHARAMLLLARAVGGQERLAEAAQAARESVRLDPEYDYAHYRLGYYHLLLSESSRASEAFEAAVRLAPNFARYGAALAASLADDPTHAPRVRALIAQTRPRAGGDAWTLYWLSLASNALRDHAEGERFAREAMKLEAATDFLRALSIALLGQERADEALEVAWSAVRMAPNECGPWCEVARAQYTLRRYGEAERTAREAVAHRATFVRGWELLVDSLIAQGRNDDARVAAQAACDVAPDNPFARKLLERARR